MAEPSDNEKALMLKEQGNRLHKAKDFKGAHLLWSKAIDEYGETADPSTIRILKGNRTAASLALRKWEAVIRDSSQVATGRASLGVDLLSIKVLRRCGIAFLNSSCHSSKDAHDVFELHRFNAILYQRAHPQNTMVLFNRAEHDTLKQIKALIKSKEEYEAINPPSEDRITYRYEVILRSQFPREEDPTMRFRDIRHTFWYSAPRVQHIEDSSKPLEERLAMIDREMMTPHEKTVIERQNAEFGDGWCCVVCGRKATVMHHNIHDGLQQLCSRVEDHASAVCGSTGDCWSVAHAEAVLGNMEEEE